MIILLQLKELGLESGSEDEEDESDDESDADDDQNDDAQITDKIETSEASVKHELSDSETRAEIGVIEVVVHAKDFSDDEVEDLRKQVEESVGLFVTSPEIGEFQFICNETNCLVQSHSQDAAANTCELSLPYASSVPLSSIVH